MPLSAMNVDSGCENENGIAHGNGIGRVNGNGNGLGQAESSRVELSFGSGLLWVVWFLQTLIYVVSAGSSRCCCREFIWCVVGCFVYWLKN